MLNRMKTLIAQLLKANAAYYGKDDPIMTDLEYDRLYSELLKHLEPLGRTSELLAAITDRSKLAALANEFGLQL